ncbi:MAG TPA: DNA-directed RNA polymerase subunit P [Candidatus Nanoarchaeia archaeon]|nr:DNA-directed RNA polymerase subunit P [Candidatus Nanoarchaeia archaeon]
MTSYKCFTCNKRIGFESLGKRIRCQYCGSKMLFKPRSKPTQVKAR